MFCVDEYQDFSPAERIFVVALADLADTTVITGDDRQEIYSFRGSSSNTLSKLAKHRPDWKYLTFNHSRRLNKEHAALVNSCSNPKNFPTIVSSRSGLKPLFVECNTRKDALEETSRLIEELITKGVRLDQIAVITRYRKDFHQMSSFLFNLSIPIGFSEINKDDLKVLKKFLDFSEAVLDSGNQALCHYLQVHLGLTENQASEVAANLRGRIPGKRLEIEINIRKKARRVLNAFLDVKGNFCVQKLTRAFKEHLQGNLNSKYNMAVANVLDRYGLLFGENITVRELVRRLRSLLENPSRYGVYVGTQHGAKGETWEHVFLIDIFDGNRASKKYRWNETLESNVFHVAITRSKERLYLMFFNKEPFMEGQPQEKIHQENDHKTFNKKLIRFLPEKNILFKHCDVRILKH
ncbi:3'-5' exonuclease [Thiorhodovibrio litoralis]|uniref:3'-5' exonuclease n=1 Tax=Thiorhodovibrio litoralis TaxID=2952932 RepID=UPI002B260620|nr:3'-5' exonuclease [Thiorhodovibrio litoralis]WPL12467.1 Putative ATP-dependent DNA helicase YjcD [Thiorhodovibrio litoralis]